MNLDISELKKYCHRNFKGIVRKLVDEQIDCFFDVENSNFKLPNHSYKIGDDVILNNYNFLHGIGKDEKIIDFVSENGILSKESIGINAKHAVKYVAGFWRVENKIALKDYVINYSGMDVIYEGIGLQVPYGELDRFVEKMRNTDHFKWIAESSMEIRFMPSLARDVNQYGFILNMDNKEGKELFKKDINTDVFDEKIKSKFGLSTFDNKKKKDAIFNFAKRASYVAFGVNKCFIEGIIVGRAVEKDKKKLEYLKVKFPDCYICNLDGKVILV